MSVENFMFRPNTLTIRVGDTVRWTFTSGAHTATSAGVFSSGVKEAGESFVFEFGAPGIYSLFCDIHPAMQATIIVES